MSKPKGRTMRASEVRTGDTVMPPSSSEQRLVLQATTVNGTTSFRYTAGVAHMPPDTIVRIYRPARVESDPDPSIPELVFQSQS